MRAKLSLASIFAAIRVLIIGGVQPRATSGPVGGVDGMNLAAAAAKDTMFLRKARVRKKPTTDRRAICEPNYRWCRSSPRLRSP